MPKGRSGAGRHDAAPDREVQVAQGESLALACKEAGVSEQSCHRWRKEYGRLQLGQARRMKDLEQENSRALRGRPPE